MNRFGAFAVHLGISLVIFIILGYFILFHWYPDFFFASDGGWQGIRIIAFVDLVLGPVLTLVVFNKTKPKTELRRDLSIIALIQATCLTAGVWVVYSERPIAMMFSDGIFQSMSTDDFTGAGIALPVFTDYSDESPTWITVALPEDPAEQSEIRRRGLATRTPLLLMTEFYVPFETAHIRESDGMTEKELERREAKTPFLEAFLAEHGGSPADYQFLPFGTRYRLTMLAFRREDDALIFVDAADPRSAQNSAAENGNSGR